MPFSGHYLEKKPGVLIISNTELAQKETKQSTTAIFKKLAKSISVSSTGFLYALEGWAAKWKPAHLLPFQSCSSSPQPTDQLCSENVIKSAPSYDQLLIGCTTYSHYPGLQAEALIHFYEYYTGHHHISLILIATLAAAKRRSQQKHGKKGLELSGSRNIKGNRGRLESYRVIVKCDTMKT